MTDYTEILNRLRGVNWVCHTYGKTEIKHDTVCHEAADVIEELERQEADALREATILAESLSRHWPDNTSWRPLDEAAGVITQISNMCAGLNERIAELEKEIAALVATNMTLWDDNEKLRKRVAELEAALKPLMAINTLYVSPQVASVICSVRKVLEKKDVYV